tara:strand:+ start:383 stop:670 length:288 start_codon:yes stop_codon:yes gene_type:complete
MSAPTDTIGGSDESDNTQDVEVENGNLLVGIIFLILKTFGSMGILLLAKMQFGSTSLYIVHAMMSITGGVILVSVLPVLLVVAVTQVCYRSAFRR